MRKCLTVSIILLLLSFNIAGIAFAEETASAVIPVVIEGGGTAYMTPEVNSPLPKETPITVGNGRTGRFYIDYTGTGEYLYEITADFIEDGKKRAADESFSLTVTVHEREDGSLYTVAVIVNNLTNEKTDRVLFRKTHENITNPDETTTKPDETTTKPEEGTTKPEETTTRPEEGTTRPEETTTRPEEKTTRPTEHTTRPTEYTTRPTEYTTRPTETTTRPGRGNPKTGDESHLLRYVLIAMASSLGLFGLSLLYTVNTKRLISGD